MRKEDKTVQKLQKRKGKLQEKKQEEGKEHKIRKLKKKKQDEVRGKESGKRKWKN